MPTHRQEDSQVAKRYLKVDVSKTVRSEVYLCVDDAETTVEPCPIHERIVRLVGNGGDNVVRPTDEIREASRKAAADIYHNEWDDDDEIDVGPITEMTKEEAEVYVVHDATAQAD